MAFIDKKSPVVLNIKLTSKGRELLSEGNLTFNYFAIGDSEIDYNFNSIANFNPFNSNILKPTDKNPELLSFITRTLSGESFNAITNIPSTPTIIQNTVQPLGFFSITTGETTFLTDTDHVKQPDAMVKISGVTGGTILTLNQAPTYLANVNEPALGDFVLVKWTNPFGENTTGYTVNKTYPTPYLIYRIDRIVSGSLAGDNLIITVDRNLPNFSGITGGSNNVLAGALVYYNYSNFTGSSENIYENYATEYINDSVIAFLQNCQCPTETFPFWNISIVYTEEIAGVQISDRSYTNYNSNIYAGFVSYIQNQAPTLKKLGVIHYTNSSPSNTYGEEFYQNTPTLHLPTVMWHKSSTTEMGLELTALGNIKYLTGETKSLNTAYYDLADLVGNVVGKIFNDLKLFVIEDQELLFALSYKSNRSWTLPDYTVGINDNVVIGCLISQINFELSGTSLSYIGATDGTITIYDIVNYVGQMILQVSGNTTGQIYLGYITGDTKLINVSGDTYNVKIFDTEAINTPTGKSITINAENVEDYYVLAISTAITTTSGLNSEFNIIQTTSNGAQIRVYKNDIGTVYGTGTTTPAVGYKYYPQSDSQISWTSFGAEDSIILNLTYTANYVIYIRDYIDYIGAPFTYYVSKDYVAVGSPLNSSFTVSTSEDVDGEYVTIAYYLATINDSYNRIVGDIEFTIHPFDAEYIEEGIGLPSVWETLETGASLGSSKKLYVPDLPTTGSGSREYLVKVREVRDVGDKNIEVATISKTITINYDN